MRPTLRKALVAAAAAAMVASASASTVGGAPLDAVEALLHPQDWLTDKAIHAPSPSPSAQPRFREENTAADATAAAAAAAAEATAAAAGGSNDDASSSSSAAAGLMSSFSQGGSGGGAASGNVDTASSSSASSDASASGAASSDSDASASASSGEQVVDAVKTKATRGPLGRRTQDNAGATTFANGKRMVVPVIAETNSDKPVGVVPPQVTSERPARVTAPPADDEHGCRSGSEDAACNPQKFAHVPSVVDKLQALPASIASTQHVGEDDKASAARRALEEGKFAPHPANFNLENALSHPERLLSVHPPVPEGERLVQEARAEVLGKVTSQADRAALAALGVDAAAAPSADGDLATAEAGALRETEALNRQQELLAQQRRAEAENRPGVGGAEKALHQELADQLKGFESDRRALRMQILDTKRALEELSMPVDAAAAGVDPHAALEADLGDIEDPADPVTGAANPALRELTPGQRHRRALATVGALRDELAERRREREAAKAGAPATKVDRALDALARKAAPAGSPLAVREAGNAARASQARANPLEAARRAAVAADQVGREELDAQLVGAGKTGADIIKAAGSGVPGARHRMVDELAVLAVKRLETPETDEQQTTSLELEMELVALDLKRSVERVERREEKLGERVPATELAEDEELHRLVTKLSELHHTRKQLSGAARQNMLADIANTIVAIKQLFPNPTTLVEGGAQATAKAAAAAQATAATGEAAVVAAGLPPLNRATHMEPVYVDSLCARSCHEARETCQSACQADECHRTCAQQHAQCCPAAAAADPSLVAVSSASSATAAAGEHVRATPECFSRFQECATQHSDCASQCGAAQPCHQECAATHEECRSPCKVEADEVVRDACGRCHVVHSDADKQQACHQEKCKAAPVTVATSTEGVTKVDETQPAAHDGKEQLPAALTEQLLATFLKDQMKFNREVMKQLQEIKEGKAPEKGAAKAKLDAAKAPQPPKPETAEGEQLEQEREHAEHAAEEHDAKVESMLRFADARASVPAVHTVPVPRVHAHHTRPMPLLKAHQKSSADPVVSHLEGMLQQIKDDEA